MNLKEDEEDDDTSDDDGEGESAEEEIKSDKEWDEAGKCSEQPGEFIHIRFHDFERLFHMSSSGNHAAKFAPKFAPPAA